jgi:hypothetical protein
MNKLEHKNTSLFLAKALGIYFIVISVAYIANKNTFIPLVIDMTHNPGLLLLSGVIALIIGILFVVSHNIWVKDWRLIITISGWMALLKGINIIIFPHFLINLSLNWIQNDTAYYITFFLTFIFGSILLYFGYIKKLD